MFLLWLGFLGHKMTGWTRLAHVFSVLTCYDSKWTLTTVHPDFTLRGHCLGAVTEDQKKSMQELSLTAKKLPHL